VRPRAPGQPAPTGSDELTRAILIVVFCGYAIIALVNVPKFSPGPGSVVVAAALLLVLVALQVGYVATQRSSTGHR
jgi:Flp pilus assembly protein TadB